jgi:gliding motility-associated-like protein
MKIKQLFTLSAALFMVFPVFANDYPISHPTAEYTDSAGVVRSMNEGSSLSEQAPLTIQFKANPGNTAGFTMNYKWSIYLKEATEPDIVNYEENFELTLTHANTYTVILTTTYTDSDGNQETKDSNPLIITIIESFLSFPNAFSPNGDGINERFQAKSYQSIVEFSAAIYNRWGQKLYSWTDPKDGWDGTFNGKPVKQGVYFVNVKAKGADGHEYHIRRDVNLLRGYTESSGSSNNN